MPDLIWIHEDFLSENHPVFKKAGTDATSVFIWDKNYFKSREYSTKRQVFLFETLCSLPFDIYEGDTLDILKKLATKHKTETLYMPETPNPVFQEIAKTLAQDISVEIIETPPFADVPMDKTYKRFFQYWKKAKKQLLKA